MDMDGDLLVAGGYNYRDQAVAATWGTGMVWAFKRDANDMYQLLGNVTAPDALQCKIQAFWISFVFCNFLHSPLLPSWVNYPVLATA
jgi:hypothetical protein